MAGSGHRTGMGVPAHTLMQVRTELVGVEGHRSPPRGEEAQEAGDAFEKQRQVLLDRVLHPPRQPLAS